MMLTVEEFAKKYLWQPGNAPQMVDFCSALGSDKAPRAKRSDPDFYFNSDDYQIILHFVDEDYLAKREVEKYGTAPMLLISAEIPVESDTDTRKPVIQLPIDVVPGVTRKDVLASMGKAPDKSYESSGVVRNDQWFHETCRVVYSYGKEGELKRVQIVSNKY
ncbi:hypothetical protein [Diaphorobacter caeni]|uniref:hypothetical protein n=1 Tax=Diaphorobacter caeni TaxID=2784387 RepID=UPI00188E1856|nr:hypothetical protein [Diaphorobacter caeni]MBF5004443.1 hypothetical protein [Diaphorobacter caeni]